jgi:hypothetical protein
VGLFSHALAEGGFQGARREEHLFDFTRRQIKQRQYMSHR